MAQFRATISGGRGEVSRLGSKASGVLTEANGWNSGVKVVGYVDDQGNDVFDIFATSGSSHINTRIFIGQVVLEDGGIAFKLSKEE